MAWDRTPSLHRLLTCVLLLALLGALAAPNPARASGRDLPGFVQVADVTDAGMDVQVTLDVLVVNSSAQDLTGVTVVLTDSLLTAQEYGTFEPVSIADGDSARVSARITIPHDEYDRWASGMLPALGVRYVGTSGVVVERPLDVATMLPGLGE